jgi:hypothetical protein
MTEENLQIILNTLVNCKQCIEGTCDRHRYSTVVEIEEPKLMSETAIVSKVSKNTCEAEG